MNSAPKAKGNWKKIKMMKGFPTTYKGEIYYAPVIYITETGPEKIANAQKDPRVKTKKGLNEELLGSIILTGCLLIKANTLLNESDALDRLEAFDSGDMDLYDSFESKGVFPEDENEWYPLPEDIQSPLLTLGDNKRISMAFKAMNRLQEEELSDFFG